MRCEQTDAELVAAAVEGDRQGFTELITRHGARARAAAQSVLGPADGAEDVEQDAVLAAFLGLPRLREPAHFGSWLAAIAANLARMRLRRGNGPSNRLLLGTIEPSPEEALEVAELVHLVRRALRVLSEAQRAIVLMHYAEGRSCDEIAALVGRSPVAVRVALHRARRQLRDRLAPALAHEAPLRKEDFPMVEVTVEDVVVRMLPGPDEEARLANERLRIVLLREKEGGRVLPIWIGSPEGDALALQLGGESMPRPLTADLMARLLEALGAQIERVTISSLREKTFYAVVTVSSPTGTHDVDARPSDALNLAARVGAPIFVEDEVLDEAGIAPEDDLHARLAEEMARHTGEEPREGEWRSLSPELVKSLHEPPFK
jgi:hypothetical protein